MAVIESKNTEAVLFVTEHGAALMTVDEKLPKPRVKPTFSSNDLAIWGSNNLYPQEILEDIRKTPVLSSALGWISKAWISGGIAYGVEELDQDGKLKLKRKKDPRVEAFLRNNMIQTQYLPMAAKHFLTFGNTFQAMVLQEDRKEIIALKPYQTPWCRVSKQNENSGLSQFAFINAQWDKIQNPDDPLVVKMPLVHNTFMPHESLRLRDQDGLVYMYRESCVPFDEACYARPDWHSIRESKWLKYANDIPEFKTALMKNQMTIKYHIRIPSYYFEWKYDGLWSNMTPEEKKAAKDAEFKKIDECLSGTSNAGKSIWSGFKYDEEFKKEFPGLTIDRLDDKVQNGALIEDTQEANYHILYSLAFDGTLIGNTPGKGMGSGSGSDKREAWNILMTVSKPDQDKVLSPIKFISDYNQWGTENEQYSFWFENYYIQTLNEVTPKHRNTTAQAA